MEHGTPGAVFAVAVFEADGEEGGFTAVGGVEVEDVLSSFCGEDDGQFFGFFGYFVEFFPDSGGSRGREEAVANLPADVCVRIGEAFGAFGVFVDQDEHGRAASADLGGHLGLWDTPSGPDRIRRIQQEGGEVFVLQGRLFEVPVLDEPHLFGHFSEKPLTFCGDNRGPIRGPGGLQNLIPFGRRAG